MFSSRDTFIKYQIIELLYDAAIKNGQVLAQQTSGKLSLDIRFRKYNH